MVVGSGGPANLWCVWCVCGGCVWGVSVVCECRVCVCGGYCSYSECTHFDNVGFVMCECL